MSEGCSCEHGGGLIRVSKWSLSPAPDLGRVHGRGGGPPRQQAAGPTPPRRRELEVWGSRGTPQGISEGTQSRAELGARGLPWTAGPR